MSTKDVSVKVPRPLLDMLSILGEEHNRSGAGELRQAATAWVSVHSRDEHGETFDDPEVAYPAPDEAAFGVNLNLYSSVYASIAALAADHKRTIPAEIRAAIRGHFRVHFDDLARLEIANEAVYRRG